MFGKIEDFVSKGIGKVSDVLETGQQKIRQKLPRGIMRDIFYEGVLTAKDILGAKTREVGEDILKKKADYVEDYTRQMARGSGLKDDIRDKTRETLGIGEEFWKRK